MQRRSRIVGRVCVGIAVFLVLVASVANLDQAISAVGFGIAGLAVVAVGVTLILAGSASGQVADSTRTVLGVEVPAEHTAAQPVRRRLVLGGVATVLVGCAGAVAGVVLRSEVEPARNRGPVDGPAVRAQASRAVNGSTTLPLPRPADTAPGDILIAQVHARGREAFQAPSGWSLIASVTGASGDVMESYWRRATASEPLSYDFSSASTFGKGGGITAWSGINPDEPILGHQIAERVHDPDVAVAGITTMLPRTPLLMLVGAIGPVSIAPEKGMQRQWSVDAPAGEYRSSTMCAATVWTDRPPPAVLTARTSDAVGFGGWVAMAVALRASSA